MNTSLTEDDLAFTLGSGLGAEAIDERQRRTCRVTDLGNRATTVAYAVRSFGMSRRSARELLNTGLRLRDLRLIDVAFAASRLSWSRVRRLCEVATPDGTGMPHARFGLHFELEAVDWQMWENARAKLRAEFGDDAELRDVDILKEVLRLVLASDAEGRVPGRKPVEGGPFRVLVREETVVTKDGEEPIAPQTAEAVTSDIATPPAMRAKVFARDGQACAKCKSRRGLHAHHVHWRSKGGPTTPGNLVTICARCHSLVHEGFLDVEVAQYAAAANAALAFAAARLAGHLDRCDDRGERLTLRTQ